MALTKKERDHQYYLKNKEKILKRGRAYNKRYYLNNKEKNRINQRKFASTPKGFFKVLISNAKRRGKKVEMTQNDFLNWFSKQEKCFYCDIPAERIDQKMFGRLTRRLSIDRINSQKPYSVNNIVASCLRCNVIKNDFFTQEEMRLVGQQFVKPKWQNL